MLSLRTVGLSIALLSATPLAFAQDATGTASGKHFSVVGGVAVTQPTRNPQIAGMRTDVDGEAAPTLGLSYNINDNWSVEAWGADKSGRRMTTRDGKLASADAQPYALSGQYHFGDADKTVRPYVGLGYAQTEYSNESATSTGGLAGQRVGIETAKGPMATAGIDVNFSPTWFARADARFTQDKSDVKVDGVKAGEAQLDPVTVGIGIGARF